MVLSLDYQEPPRSRFDWRVVLLLSVWILFCVGGFGISFLSFFLRWTFIPDPIDRNAFIYGWIGGILLIVGGSACGFAAARLSRSAILRTAAEFVNWTLAGFFWIAFVSSLMFADLNVRGILVRAFIFLTPPAVLLSLAKFFHRRITDSSQGQ